MSNNEKLPWEGKQQDQLLYLLCICALCSKQYSIVVRTFGNNCFVKNIRSKLAMADGDCRFNDSWASWKVVIVKTVVAPRGNIVSRFDKKPRSCKLTYEVVNTLLATAQSLSDTLQDSGRVIGCTAPSSVSAAQPSLRRHHPFSLDEVCLVVQRSESATAMIMTLRT